MNFIAPRAKPLIREIPLSRLALAPENVRKTPPDAQADAALKASIAAFGLLENLVVRPDEPDSDGNERFAVVAGGRRLKAMQTLVEDTVFDADHPVPCQVRTGDAEPGEVSLAENIVRIAMHPADQVVAFAKLVEAGQSVSAIAARFGTSERVVEQRLRLGNAAPELLDAYRADQIDLEVLKAFAVTTDRDRQMAVWEQVAGQGYRPSAGQVKRLLTEERVPGRTAVARFVGVEAYEAAGGAVLRDLFADEHEHGVWFEDPVLLEKLATHKLQASADELATRWKWAVPMIEAAWDDTARYGRIEPQPGTPTDEERAEIEKLETRYDELRGMDDDEWTEALLEEAGRIEARLDEIEGAVEARAVFRREDIAMAGCIVTIGRDGNLQVIQGLVKPEDMPKPTEAARTVEAGTNAGNGHDPDAADHGTHAAGPSVSQPMAPPRDREAEARKEAGVGIGLADDLRSVRTALVKAKLAGDFEAAFDLTLFQMGRAVFTPGYRDHALDIAVKETPDRPNTRMNDADFAAWSPGEAMLEDRSGLSLDSLMIEDDGESFAAVRALPRAEPGEPARILVVDDDPRMLRFVRDALAKAGYAPLVTGEPQELAHLIRTEKPRLVLLDLVLPGGNGIELMERVPELSDLPVIFISGYGRDETVAAALESGAADYIVKPFSPTELVARVRAALRRHEAPEPFVLGKLEIDYDRRRVTVEREPVTLTATEYELLRVLALNAGRVMTYDTLLRRVWNGRNGADANLVRIFVRNLRKKLGDDAANPAYIFNERGVGYRMAAPGEE